MSQKRDLFLKWYFHMLVLLYTSGIKKIKQFQKPKIYFVFKHTIFLLLRSPMYTTTFMSGSQIPNSLCHDVIVDSGTTIRKGPYSWWALYRYERNAMTCMVLPNPISSARITLFFLREKRNIYFKLSSNKTTRKTDPIYFKIILDWTKKND